MFSVVLQCGVKFFFTYKIALAFRRFSVVYQMAKYFCFVVTKMGDNVRSKKLFFFFSNVATSHGSSFILLGASDTDMLYIDRVRLNHQT